MAKKKRRTELQMVSYMFTLGYIKQAQARLEKYLTSLEEGTEFKELVISKIKKGYI